MAGKRQHIINISAEKKLYFASDQHFGSPTHKESLVREKHFVKWLSEIQTNCAGLFLLGDLFDFWFEYKQVVPKGFVRVLGKLAEFTDNGIPVYFFIGNHDLWMNSYLRDELNISVFNSTETFIINEKTFLIGHGDGLGPGDYGYKIMKKIFTNPIAQKLYYLLHPDFGVWLGKTASQKNKYISGDDDVKFLGEENEWLIQYSKRKLESMHYDFFVFGHRHLPIEVKIKDSLYVNLGDWINYFTYAEFSLNQGLRLKRYAIK